MSKDYLNDFLAFFQDYYKVDGAFGPKPLTPAFLIEFLGHAFKDGKPTARNVLDARSKKQGKSALAGAVGLYMAIRKPYSEVYIIASDKEQAADRVLKAIKYACENGPLVNHAKVYKDNIELDNKSIIKAFPADWQGASGGNPSCVIVDEMHAWIHESQRRLFDEFLIPPQQPDGVRWIASYAGFLGESELLKDWWDRGIAGEKVSEELPIYRNKKANLLAFVDTGPESWRMEWMSDEYINEIRESERPSTFRRLWLNEWVANESAFVPQEAWEACYSEEVRLLTEGDKRKVVLGVDASTTRDLTALIGTWYNKKSDTVEVAFIRAFKPKRGFLRMGKPTIDLEAVRDEIVRLKENDQLDAVYYDPYQMASIAIELERAGIRMKEFPQTNQRTEADQQLYDAIVGGMIRHPNDPDLNEHIRNSIAKETVRGFRLAKDKTSLKIDLAVALSMSLYGCLKFQKHSGNVRMVTNPFYTDKPEGMDYHYTDSGEFLISDRAPLVHKPGITWRNCRHSNKGCPACIAELEAEGYFERDEAAAQLMRDAHPEHDTPMSEEDQREINYQLAAHRSREQGSSEAARGRHAIRSAMQLKGD